MMAKQCRLILDDTDMIELIGENLRYLSEIRARQVTRIAEAGPACANSPEAVYELLAPEMEGLPQEQLRVVLLNTKNQVIDTALIYQGQVDNVQVRMAEIFRPAVIKNALSVILVHNHPTGDPVPSDDDKQTTQRAKAAGELLDIKLLDHIIIGRGRFVSLKRYGVL